MAEEAEYLGTDRGGRHIGVGKPLYLRSRSFLCLFLGIIMSIAIPGGHAAEIEDVIPAYSLAYMAISDIPEIWEGAKSSSSWQAFLSSDELGNEIQDIQAGMNLMEQILGIDLQTLLEVFGRRIAFVQIYMRPGEIQPPIVIADVGDSKRAAEIIWKIEQALLGSPSTRKKKENTEGSIEGWEVRPQAGTYRTISFGSFRYAAEESTFRYAFLSNLFVLTPEQESFEAVVDVYLGEVPSLIHDPKFDRVRSKVSVDGEVFAYLNLEVLWSMNTWGLELGLLLQVLGLREMKSVVWATTLLDTTRVQEMYVYTGNNGGLLASLFAEPERLYSPHLIPASNADIFLAAHADSPLLVWKSITGSISNALGEEDYDRVQSDISEFERETGISLENDLLSSLTGEVGFAMTYPEAMETIRGPESLLENNLTIFCGVKDRGRCAMCIERILSALDAQLQQIEYSGVTLYRILAPGGSEVPVGYMFAGDMLIFGGFRKLEDVINQEPPLAVSEEFVQVSSQLPQELGLLCYINLSRMQDLLLMVNPQAQLDVDTNIPEGTRLNPLGSIGATLTYDGEGLKSESIGTPGKNWLETIGSVLLHVLVIREPF